MLEATEEFLNTTSETNDVYCMLANGLNFKKEIKVKIKAQNKSKGTQFMAFY